MILYGLRTCESCRKALKALPQARFRDVRSDGVPDEVLAAAWARFGAALINTRSATWRGLDGVERAADPLALLRRHPTLMKRPLIVDGARLFLGAEAAGQAMAGR
ncbi:MAG: hypothetical protein Kow0058_18920 [Roseovarius sp.]